MRFRDASGNGDLTLSGGNSRTPGIVIGPQGTLRLSGTLGIDVGSIHFARLIQNSGTVLYDGTKNHFLATPVTGFGKLVHSGTGTLLVTTNLDLSETTINAGIVQIGDGGTTGNIQGNVTNNSILVLNRSNAATFGGSISGAGSLVKQGSGTLTLSAGNTYGGPTLLSAGTLRAASSTALSANSAFTVNLQLDLNGFSNAIGCGQPDRNQ